MLNDMTQFTRLDIKNKNVNYETNQMKNFKIDRILFEGKMFAAKVRTRGMAHRAEQRAPKS